MGTMKLFGLHTCAFLLFISSVRGSIIVFYFIPEQCKMRGLFKLNLQNIHNSVAGSWS